MTRQPTVSVVVPTRDRPELLRAALAAILAQEYAGGIEAVVVFDQSTPDESLTDLAGLTGPDRTVRVIRNQRTPGLAGARNSGTLAAEGELVAFCDDDDEWLPGKLAAQVEALTADPAAEFVCCGIRVTYDGHTVDRVLDKDRITLDDLLRDRMTELHPSTFLIRAAALRDGFGLVDEEIPGSYAEDYEFLLRAARSAPLLNLRTPSVLVRWHKRSYFAQRWDTISEALQWLLHRYPEFAGQPAGEARVTGQIAFARAASGDRRGALRWARRTLRRNPREPRAYLALAVAGRVVRADAVLRTLHKRGRGI
ncbi:glycosyltransferase family 2 protein [Micromonospora profundi]|uniref:Glycosyltransferase family 2 protein n=1 Tax=Micromonospora profundi TaxID=1420889 RepID=A0AAJ6KY67_9ACTN|nr:MULTISPECIES: glycosyltransferase family 2 protein [Micromonospora]KOX09008.1 glycosyl transferase [Micromonospora sp. NRRL B-16802]NJC13310.1 GT2 family glycosyltransferase [Micromonospora profundi]WLS44924.1 glycosyltransferase family 2 protein [Micromonospora profundi]